MRNQPLAVKTLHRNTDIHQHNSSWGTRPLEQKKSFALCCIWIQSTITAEGGGAVICLNSDIMVHYLGQSLLEGSQSVALGCSHKKWHKLLCEEWKREKKESWQEKFKPCMKWVWMSACRSRKITETALQSVYSTSRKMCICTVCVCVSVFDHPTSCSEGI